MNILKESLLSSSKSSSSSTKSRKLRQNHSRNNRPNQDNDLSSEPLLSPWENGDHSIELGTIDSDNDDNNDDKAQTPIRHLVRSRHSSKQSSIPAAHGGGSIVIIE